LCSCEPVSRMRESTLMFNRFAADALNSMFAPDGCRIWLV
jgi:hypothetical protein